MENRACHEPPPMKIVYLNGRFLPESSASVPVFDRCFLYGDGLFETIRVSAGQLCHWALHVDRLMRGARYLRIWFRLPAEDLLSQALELIRLNSLPDGLLRLTLSRGVGPRGYSPVGAMEPTLVMTLHANPAPPQPHPPAWHLITSTIRVPARDPLTRFKTCNRLPYVLARMEADDANADDALLLNHDGNVAESSCANLFWINDDTLHTPPLASGPLEGITRARLLQLAPSLQIRTMEQDVQPDALKICHGLFLTLTSHGVVQIASLDGQSIPVHPLIARCRQALA
jgi:branched-chain amino acid aminotransferase